MDYFIFNDIISTDKRIILLDYNKVLLPPVFFDSIDGPAETIWMETKKYQDIIFSLRIAVLKSDIEEYDENSLQETLTQELRHKNKWLLGKGNLILPDDITRYYEVIYIDSEYISDNEIWQEYVVTYRAKSTSNSVDEIKVPDISQTIFNRGTEETAGIITVTLSSNEDHFQITLMETGEYIRIDDNLKNGDIITIDLKKEYLEVNGIDAMKFVTYSSDFFKLPFGKFNLTLSSGTGSLIFRERWL